MAAGTKVVVATSPYTDGLINNKSLGMTFNSEVEFIDDVVTYLQNPQQYPNNLELRKQNYMIFLPFTLLIELSIFMMRL